MKETTVARVCVCFADACVTAKFFVTPDAKSVNLPRAMCFIKCFNQHGIRLTRI